MDQHISRLDTNTDDSGQQPNHGVGSGLRLLLQSFLASCLDLSDLADNKAQPRHVALQLGQGVWWQRHALRGVHGCQTFGCLAQGWFEVANPQPGQGRLYPVHNPRAFSYQAFALPVRPLGVLFGNRWHARHAAMASFPTQPPQEPPLEQFGVQPVGLCPAMFPRNCYTRGMDHVRLDPARFKPARQPKAVAAGFEGKRNPRDRAAGPDRLIPPAVQHRKQPFRARVQLLARLTLNTRYDRQPASSTGSMIVLFWSRATRDLLKSFGWGIAALHRLHPATKLPRPRRPLHSVFRFLVGSNPSRCASR